MRSLQDTIYNWLTIKVVADVRKDDSAAQETETLFKSMLMEDHEITSIEFVKEEPMYYVSYEQHGEMKKTRFPIELIDVMINQISEEPERYKNYENEEA
ncbi:MULTISPECIES: hypothetical protein [Bacillus]|uniref:hypothetical protein n=1 Tax=Bacillus TaxID=1386 RepID=UPI000BB77B30|nr:MULTISPECIES: hypothetical protein [Bacillus]